jgi:hypothetical protein
MKKFIASKILILRDRLDLGQLRVRNFYLPLAIFLLTTLTLLNAYHTYRHYDLWSGMPEAGGNAFHFCEANRMDEAIRQPSNTWSNLGYLLVGLFALTLAAHDYKNKDRRASGHFLVMYPFFSVLYGLSCLYLFIGSFMYHASLTLFFQKFDQTGLYSVIGMVLILNIYKINPYLYHKGEWKNTHVLAKLLVIILNIAFFKWLWKFNINILVPGMLVITLCTAVYYIRRVSRTDYFLNYLYVAYFIMLAAGSIWLLDRQGVVCNPDSIWQGHAVWHILTAASMFFIYLYYRSGTLTHSPDNASAMAVE